MNEFQRIGLRAICLLLCACGCTPATNNPTTFPVSGVVTLKGKPLADADVVFVPENQGGQAAFGKTDATGTYKLTTFAPGDGAVEGKYKVKVSKLDTSKSGGSGKVFSSSEEELEFYNPEDGDKVQISKNLVPKKFTDHNTSALTHAVASSASTFDIKLD
jgi:hypothetical protein